MIKRVIRIQKYNCKLMTAGFALAIFYTVIHTLNKPDETASESNLNSPRVEQDDEHVNPIHMRKTHVTDLLSREHRQDTAKSPPDGLTGQSRNGQSNASDITVSVNRHVLLANAFNNIYDPFAVKEPIEYLENYRNPCFWQSLEQENPYHGVEIDRRLSKGSLKAMRDRYAQYLRAGERTRLRCFPAFFVAGFQKCGTTELQKMLPIHKQVHLTIKENHWWNRGRYKAHMEPKGHRVPLEGYLDLFDNPAEKIRHVYRNDTNGHDFHPIISGDVSPALLWDQQYWKEQTQNKNKSEPEILTPQLIHSILPQAKFIIILRNPTARLYSDWLFFGTRGGSAQHFHEKVQQGIHWFNTCLQTQPVRACAYNPIESDPYANDLRRENSAVWYHPTFRLRMGLYHVFIKDLLDVFPRNQVMILKLEDYSVDRLNSLEKMFAFLDLDADPAVAAHVAKEKPHNHNTKGYESRGEILPETKQILDNFYGLYNSQLAQLLGDNRFLWT